MKSVLIEDARLKVSADVQTDTRVLDFYAATFSPMPDKMGDRIAPEAFDTWLAAFYAKGDPLPISFAHAAIREDTDPAAIIGYAPATPEHVWVDQIGLRVKAFVYTDTETARQVARLIDSGVVKSASLAMFIGNEVPNRDGSRTITAVKAVKEAGPCMYPANPEAAVLSLKSLVHHTETTDEPWDGQVYRERLTEGDEVNSFKAYAWRDADAFAFLHHEVSNEGLAGAANLEACRSIIHLLNHGRKIDLKAQPWIGDRAPIYDHAAAHLKDAGVAEIPELVSLDEPATQEIVTADAPTEDVELKAWDAGAAMGRCNSAGDFRSIAFEKANDSAPDSAAHWALPHHDNPHGPANPDGVSAALGRLNQTGPTVLSKDAIRSHLEGHQSSSKTEPAPDVDASDLEALLLKHAGPGYVQQIHDIAMRAGAECGTSKTEDHEHVEEQIEDPPAPETATETPPPAAAVVDVDELISRKAGLDPQTELRMMKIRRIKALHAAAPRDALSYPAAVTTPEVSDEPMPEGVPALKTHLEDVGHQMTASAVDVEPDEHLRVVHKRLHDTTDPGHTHPGMKHEQMDNVRATLRRLRIMKAGIA